MLCFTQRLVVLLLFYVAADGTHRGRLRTLSFVRVRSDVSRNVNQMLGFCAATVNVSMLC